ncbi:hypothetical protein C8J56DRAFT_1050700 [Mycena floridula]|nr:hypothetical protein C8J56DRAFT_1050700 [Mycena floridula]
MSGLFNKYLRDDLARRPSSTTMYHSAASLAIIKEIHDVTTRMAPSLMTGLYRMALPRDCPDWDAPVPTPAPYCGEVYPDVDEQEQNLFTNPNASDLQASFIGAADHCPLFQVHRQSICSTTATIGFQRVLLNSFGRIDCDGEWGYQWK